MSLRATLLGLNRTPPLPPPPQVPDAPTGLTLAVAGAAKDDVLLSWGDPNSGLAQETGLEVEYSTDNATWGQIATPAADTTSYTHTTPTLGEVMHYYRVRAVNAAGESAWATASIAGIYLALFAAWEMEDTNWTDSVSGYDGSLVAGTVTSVAGKVGNAGSASSNARLQAASNADLQGGDTDWCIAKWFQITGAAPSVVLCGKDNLDTGGGREWLLFRWTDNYMRLQVANGASGGIGDVTDTSGTISLSTWYHVVAYHSATNNQVGVRVNGNAFTTAATTGAAGTNNAPFGIIGRDSGPDATTLQDQTLWWRRVPSVAELDWLYNAGSGRALF